MDAIETLGIKDLFDRYSTEEQKMHVDEMRQRFWDLLLCIDERGIKLAELDEPIPFAAEILQAWSNDRTIVYLTGRPETTREITLGQLNRFGFPTENIQLVMYRLKDYAHARGLKKGPTLVETRQNLFTKIAEKHDVQIVVDDYPTYFDIYSEFGVPNRIGFYRLRRFKEQDYINHGATLVVKGWDELKDIDFDIQQTE